MSFSIFSWSQDISGKVLDTQNDPIVGAYVLNISTDKHAHTNEVGQFLLKEVNIGDTLEVVHLGYEGSQLIVRDLDSEIKILLKETIFQIEEIVVGQNVKKTNLLSDINMRLNPVNSSQEILTKVPGLFIGQHAGGGKAEQIFLRGFDIDHGTDVTLSVDGLPVNMVSHAHGQGYADLHFVIPETVEFIDFGKGPYYADKGNFNTAGYVAMQTKDRLDESLIKLEVGQFNTFRTMAMLDVLNTENHHAYLASEFLLSDGPFDSPQNFSRQNFLFKYNGEISPQNNISFLASHFTSKWDASGQVPQRAVDAGLIGRFGAVDDTEGGQTSRTNLSINFNRMLDEDTYFKTTVFYSQYDFELFSNFTFFLEDPDNADQIRQYEERELFGAQSEWNHSTYLFEDVATLLQAGVGFRHDNVDNNTLARTKNRQTTLENIALGDVDETNLFGFVSADFEKNNWLIQPGLRFDLFKFNYVDDLQTLFERKSAFKPIVSPKFNVIYNASPSVQLFAKSGVGFHSNDTRVVVAGSEQQILPAAYGADLGTIFKPRKRLVVNAALWYLFLQQEFVYVGDAGIVEPSGRTRRMGVDVGFRWQLANNFFANADFNYAFARSVDDPEGNNFIPLAPDLTSTGGFSYISKNFVAGINYRWIGNRPANEDNSIVAEGYFITDINVSYEWKRFGLGLNIENVLNQEWNETQFATESRLQFEPTSVEEIHFTPGTPFFLKANLSYKF
ncbi:MAG: TonB-dependent receptor [Saprospiraceae bacterium]